MRQDGQLGLKLHLVLISLRYRSCYCNVIFCLYIYLFIYLFIYITWLVHQYCQQLTPRGLASSRKIIDENNIGRGTDERGRGLIWSYIQAFHWRDLNAKYFNQDSLSPTEIWTRDLKNTKQDCCILVSYVRFSCLQIIKTPRQSMFY
jgi:hypothetical protein